MVCAGAGAVVFHVFGNANQGYIHTSSLFVWWFSQWSNPAAETEHGWLIAALAIGLLVRNLRSCGRGDADCGVAVSSSASGMGSAGFQPGPRSLHSDLAALVALTGGLLLHAVGFTAQQARVSILGLLVFVWGVLRLGGGLRWGRAAAFPLGFMVFAIPFSGLDSIGFWLRLWVIEVAAPLAQAAGIDVIQNGTQLFSPDGRYNYDVAAACSGIRSLMALAALSLLIGYLTFRSWWRWALLLVLCFPLVYLGNVARISSIVFAAEVGGAAWGDRAHEVMGYGVFAIVLGGVLAAARLLERWAPEGFGNGARGSAAQRASRRDSPGVGGAMPTRDGNEPESTAGWGRSAHLATVSVIVLLLAVAEVVLLQRLSDRPPRGQVGIALASDGENPVELPTYLGRAWVGMTVPVSRAEREILPPDTGYSRMEYVATRGGQRVFLSIVLSGRDRSSIHRPELCLLGQGWSVEVQGRHSFSHPQTGATHPATLLDVRRVADGGRGSVNHVVAYWFVSGDGVVASHWERLVRDAWNRLTKGRADRWAYVLMQTDASDGPQAALERMQAVLNETLPVFQPPSPT